MSTIKMKRYCMKQIIPRTNVENSKFKRNYQILECQHRSVKKCGFEYINLFLEWWKLMGLVGDRQVRKEDKTHNYMKKIFIDRSRIMIVRNEMRSVLSIFKPSRIFVIRQKYFQLF